MVFPINELQSACFALTSNHELEILDRSQYYEAYSWIRIPLVDRSNQISRKEG